mmetsp:Transcript_6882/g.12318  ORF Transcript_6882/g.12318 Transcript_6882/m.12318 type:complete len:1801 (-) Transcript_6882:1695-7097(-)
MRGKLRPSGREVSQDQHTAQSRPSKRSKTQTSNSLVKSEDKLVQSTQTPNSTRPPSGITKALKSNNREASNQSPEEFHLNLARERRVTNHSHQQPEIRLESVAPHRNSKPLKPSTSPADRPLPLSHSNTAARPRASDTTTQAVPASSKTSSRHRQLRSLSTAPDFRGLAGRSTSKRISKLELAAPKLRQGFRLRQAAMSDDRPDMPDDAQGARSDAVLSALASFDDAAGSAQGLQNLLRRWTGLSGFVASMPDMSHSELSRLAEKLQSDVVEDHEKIDALSKVCEFLSVASEKALITFRPDAFVSSIVVLLQTSGNPDLMLMAARCLCDMMEVLPSSTLVVSNSGAVVPLCESLLNVEFIDLAEQSLFALEKISREYPSGIVRAGGFAAALTFFDFFATSVQRVAASLACNLCRNCPREAFDSVLSVLPNLLVLLDMEDQRLRELGLLSFSRLTESFKKDSEKLELLNGQDGKLIERVSAVIKAPYATVDTGPSVSSSISVLTHVARGSSKLSCSLLEDNHFVIALAAFLHPDVSHLGDVVALVNAFVWDVADLEDELVGVRTRRRRSSLLDATQIVVDEERQRMYSERPNEIKFFGNAVLERLLELYPVIESIRVRKLILGILVRFVKLLSSEMLEDMLKTGSEIYEVVPLTGSLMGEDCTLLEISYGLRIASALLGKLNDKIFGPFLREGVIHEIRRLRSDVETCDEDKDADQISEVKRKARAICEKYFDCAKISLDDDIAHLKTLAERLRTCSVEESSNTFSMLAERLCSKEGISKFELKTSGLVDALYVFLCGSKSKQEHMEKLLQILSVFSEPRFENVFGMLLSKLIGIVTSQEKLRVIRSDGGSADSSGQSHSLRKLATPITLRLVRDSRSKKDETCGLRDFPPIPVSVEPLSTMASIEEYLWARVRPFRNRPAVDPGTSARGSQLTRRHSEQQNTKKPPTLAPNSSSASQRVASSPGSEPLGAPFEMDEEFELDRAMREAAGFSSSDSSLEREPEEKAVDPDAKVSTHKIPNEAEDDDEEMDDDDEDEEDTDDDDDDEDENDVVGLQMFGISRSPVLSSSLGSSYAPVELDLDSVMGSELQKRATSTQAAPDRSAENIANPVSSAKNEKKSGAKSYACVLKKVPDESGSGSRSPPAETQESGQSDEPQELLVFRLNDRVVPRDFNILQALARAALDKNPSLSKHDVLTGGRIWGEVHQLTYSLAETDSKTRNSVDEKVVDQKDDTEDRWINLPNGAHVELPKLELPDFVDEHLARIFVLIDHLYWTNRNYGTLSRSLDVLAEKSSFSFVRESSFECQKLSSKVLRQLQDPVVLIAGLIPTWCSEIATEFSYLLPFDVRIILFQSTSLGLAQAITRLQARSISALSSSRESGSRLTRNIPIPRIARQKIKIHRDRLLDSGIKMMELYAGHRTVLEVQYYDEAGTGLGPTLEFYALISKELMRSKLGLWRSSNEKNDDSFVIPTGTGLFPARLAKDETARARTLQLFEFMGRLVAKALMDGRLLDLRFSVEFAEILLDLAQCISDRKSVQADRESYASDIELEILKSLEIPEPALGQTGIHLLYSIDHGLASSLSKLLKMSASEKDAEQLEHLGLYFTLPEDETLELIPEGRDVSVTRLNVDQYVHAVARYVIYTGIKNQVRAFANGFCKVLNLTCLLYFQPEELEVLLCGPEYEHWSPEFLAEVSSCDHGYTYDSHAVQSLFQVLSGLEKDEQRAFMRFITGTPRLPVGGLRALNPRLTIVKRVPDSGLGPDDSLPSVMTCTNYLKLPDYSSREILREKLCYAMNEGHGSFHLS